MKEYIKFCLITLGLTISFMPLAILILYASNILNNTNTSYLYCLSLPALGGIIIVIWSIYEAISIVIEYIKYLIER